MLFEFITFNRDEIITRCRAKVATRSIPPPSEAASTMGLGIGLTFSRWGAEANGGRLYARNLPGRGCVFTLDLPRSLVPATAAV
jgi:signal transduction histidine kinase